MEDFPPEVRAPPSLLAGLVGATQIHGRLTDLLHQVAQESAGHRRLRYDSYSYDMRIPPCKRGAKDAQGYVVGCILKPDWLEKVCNRIPAVLVVCFDWSEVLPDKDEISQAIQQLNHALRQTRDREIRVVVFAVLQASVADPEAVCFPLRQQLEGTSFQLISAQGFGSEDMAAKSQKLERVVYQSAISFYADEERRLKAGTAIGVSSAWCKAALEIRKSIKIGFLSEFRKDTRGAVVNYITAYQSLMHKTCNPVPTAVERIGLCNIISVRMYQLYVQSRDLASAVHHFRIHTATLQQCADGAEGGVAVWRKWHWLANNHSIFAEVLESVLQRSPITLDLADMWHFPGFHYQAAAGFVRRVKACVATVAKDARPQPPGGTAEAGGGGGGPAASGHLAGEEQPEEVGRQCFEADHDQRALSLLTRAQAAYKERKYFTGAAVCAARMAEVYIEEGNMLAATMLYERLQRERGEGDEAALAHFSRWPVLRRYALERALLCALRRLGVAEVPSICERSLKLLPGGGGAAAAADAATAAAGTEPAAEAAEAAEPAKAAEAAAPLPTAELRRQLLADGFAYLCAVNESPGHDPVPAKEQQELLEVLRAAAAGPSEAPGADADGAGVVEVLLDRATADVSFRDGAGGCQVAVLLRTELPVPLELSAGAAATSIGADIVLAPLGGGDWSDASLCVDDHVELVGTWPATAAEGDAPAGGEGEERLLSVRLTWAAVPSVQFLVQRLSLRRRARLLSAPCLPPAPLCRGAGGAATAPTSLGVLKPRRAALPLRAEPWLPVDPSVALISEPFVMHVVLIMDPLDDDTDLKSSASLRLSCTVQAQEDPTVQSAALGEEPAAFLLDAKESAEPWSMLALGGREQGTLVAKASPAGELLATARALVVPRARLGAAASCAAVKAADAAAAILVVPVVVRSGRDCRAVVSLHVEARAGEEDGGRLLHSVTLPNVTVHFRGALQVSFDDRAASPPGSRASGVPRRFSLKALTPVAVRLCRVESITLHKGEDGELTRCEPVPVLGTVGRVAPGSLHVLALPPAKDPDGVSILGASFIRDAFTASFFPWLAAAGAEEEPCLGGEPPQASVEWPIPREPRHDAPAAGAAATATTASLVHAPTAVVAQPLEVCVTLTGAAPRFGSELKFRVEGDTGEGSQRYFLAGPLRSQALLLGKDDGAQVFATFTLVPLRPGMLTLPRVNIARDNWEATSQPSSVFVFPAAQQVLPRVLP